MILFLVFSLSITYEDIKPVLKKCLRCHIEGEDADFAPLKSYKDIMEGYARGRKCKDTNLRYVEAGNPEKSLLYLKLEDNPICGKRMPPKRPLSEEDKEKIKRWIGEGAKEK